MAEIETSTVTLSTSYTPFLLCEDGSFSGWYASQSENISLKADITDQYVEDNTTIQDHIGIKPITITLKGKIGDIVYSQSQDTTLEEDIKANETRRIASKWKQITNVISPAMSNYMSSAIGTYYQIYDMGRKYYEGAKNIAQLALTNSWFSNTKIGEKLAAKLKRDFNYGGKYEKQNPKKPEEITTLFNIAMNNRVAFTVKLDTGIFENCYITDVDIEQSESRYTANINVTLKQIRYVSTQVTYMDYNKYLDFVAQQKSAEENLGQMRGSTAFRDGRYFDSTRDLLGDKN